jgi:hypothetical protein
MNHQRMNPRSPRIARLLILTALTLPLLQLGTCATIAVESIITGAFNAITPELVDQAEDQLGLDSSSASGSGIENAGI